MAAAVIAVAIYFTFDPSATGSFFPRCTFLTLTGYKCPGCGSQRALHALLHGQFMQAVRYNAALPVFIPLLALYAIAELQRKSWQRFYTAVTGGAVIVAIVVAIVAWWVVRNIIHM